MEQRRIPSPPHGRTGDDKQAFSATGNCGSDHRELTLRVGNSIKERRIDKYLQGRFSNFSRAMIQEVIKAGVQAKFQIKPGRSD
jgi:hypothetical protein